QIVETDETAIQDELFRVRRDNGGQKEREREIEQKRLMLVRLRSLFVRSPQQIGGDLEASARAYLDQTHARLDRLIQQLSSRENDLRERIALYEWLAGRLGKNADPPGRSNDNRLIELLVALDLTDGGSRCGPLFVGEFQRATSISQIQDYR